jgi:hypothetical protein
LDCLLIHANVYRIHYRKEQRPIMLRVKDKGEHIATEGITGKRQGMRKQMMEGKGLEGKKHSKEEQGEKKNLQYPQRYIIKNIAIIHISIHLCLLIITK